MNTTTQPNYFLQLASVNVGEHIERKGQFSYLSWPFAVAQLRQFDENATWEVRRFDGLPYLTTDCGTFVEVAVTVRGVTLSQIHPVLDGRNNPIPAPSVFDINTSLQRCLVKAIALHGLGLYIYAGEDLPMDGTETESREPKKQPEKLSAKVTHMPKPSSECLTRAQLRYIENLIAETGTDETKLLDYFSFFTLDTIPKSEASRVIKELEAKRKEVA